MKTFGIDFGTSNSAIAMADAGGEVRIAAWSKPERIFQEESQKQASDTVPTVLFAPAYEDQIHVGYQAIEKYIETGLEGRFIQSIKAYLPQASFTGTTIRGRHYSIEDIIASFLRRLIAGAEQTFGEKISGSIVLGRPARFSESREQDELAEKRLRDAAKKAGLSEVRFLIEPVAAALAYEATLSVDETILVADLGGGTSDFTLLRAGPSYRNLKDRRDTILAAGGFARAGDWIDGEIVESCLFDELGFGSHYVAFTSRAPVPHWIWKKLKAWNHVSFLKDKKYLDFLDLVHRTAETPEKIDALIQIVSGDMGYLLFRAVERSKRTVHTNGRSTIQDPENGLPVRALLDQSTFFDALTPMIEEMRTMSESILKTANVKASEVDAVFLTGGTSLVPELRAAFAEIFGAEKLRKKSTFTSVVDGLARGGFLDFTEELKK